MACAGCTRVLELRILGMDHVRHLLRVHGEPLSGDEDDSRRRTINPVVHKHAIGIAQRGAGGSDRQSS